jgi:hypothetical protein
MKGQLAFGTLVVGVLAQVFEPADFNITEALLDNGVNVSAIPELAPLAAKSLLYGCSVAVSYHHRNMSWCIHTHCRAVQLPEAYLW